VVHKVDYSHPRQPVTVHHSD